MIKILKQNIIAELQENTEDQDMKNAKSIIILQIRSL